MEENDDALLYSVQGFCRTTANSPGTAPMRVRGFYRCAASGRKPAPARALAGQTTGTGAGCGTGDPLRQWPEFRHAARALHARADADARCGVRCWGSCGSSCVKRKRL